MSTEKSFACGGKAAAPVLPALVAPLAVLAAPVENTVAKVWAVSDRARAAGDRAGYGATFGKPVSGVGATLRIGKT
jgi:hypothetical protein